MVDLPRGSGYTSALQHSENVGQQEGSINIDLKGA